MITPTFSPVDLSIFASRVAAICDEMGAVLQRSAFSPNIKDRLDFSCAIFDHNGALIAQAAHIPVHVGSMAYAMTRIVSQLQWHEGDMVLLNDPYLGGTHLPDVTLIAPVFYQSCLMSFVVNRAHHADIGSETPGSMPISSRLQEEGMIIPPSYLVEKGEFNNVLMQKIESQTGSSQQTRGDFSAQLSANRVGLQRLQSLLNSMGRSDYQQSIIELNHYAQRIAEKALSQIPNGIYRFSDVLDDDGQGHFDIPIKLEMHVRDASVYLDFTGTAPQVSGNVNCPISVTAAGVYYVFSCLLPEYTPTCAGRFNPIAFHVPDACLLNARYPAAVAAGNVETSSRVVDVVMGALSQAVPERMPAASHGSMNNLAMGGTAPHRWSYYETLGGGMGAGPTGGGLDAVQTHMTNTRNTPIEVMESLYPVRISAYQIRRGSGGAGRYVGGCGLQREFQFLENATVTLLTERRRHAPWGVQNGQPGQQGCNLLNGEILPAKVCIEVQKGDTLLIKTAGGGGWGDASDTGQLPGS